MSESLIKSTIVLERVSNCLDMYRHEYKKDIEFYVAGTLTGTDSSIKYFEEEVNFLHESLKNTRYRKIERFYGNMEEVGFIGVDNNFCVLIERNYREEIIVYLCASQDAIQKAPELTPIINHYKEKVINRKISESPEVSIICKSEYGLELKSFPIKLKETPGVLFEDLYNADFYPAYERIIQSLDKNSKSGTGIILLNGDYGTGKTNLIRHIISKVNKRVIFLPPDMASALSSPNFVRFFIDYPESILIIEDAENILKTREAGGNNAVSNILNLSDGILGDILNLQVICTFNAPKEDIDEALMREGRLIEMYTFKPLSEAKTLKLYQKIHGPDALPPKKELPLSQIFNKNQHERNLEADKNKKTGFGFTAGLN